MKHIGHTLDALMRQKRIVKREIADSIGMAYSHFIQLKHRESIDAALLDKICRLIDVSPAYFFDDSAEPDNIKNLNQTPDCDAKEIQYLKKEIALLSDLVAEKERTISILESYNTRK